jgi:arginine utilization regulatory protein
MQKYVAFFKCFSIKISGVVSMDHETLLSIHKIILDYLDVGVHAIDHSGKTVIYNKKMMEIEGMEIEDVLDKNILDVFQFFQGEESILMQILNSGEPIFNSKQKYFNNIGMEINTVHNTYPIKSNDVTIAAVEIVHDVTKLERILDSNLYKKKQNPYTFDQFEINKFFPKEVLDTAKQASFVSSPLFIAGEHGTYKNVLSQCIHQNSLVDQEKFYCQNCTELSEPYIEKLLFGDQNQAGILEKASGGTLLLEEIHILSTDIQAKLLYSFHNNIVQRLGENKWRPIEVRIIGALSEDPVDAIAEGKLLKDLYYYLSKSSIVIPPLRNRKTEIQEIILTFIKKYNDLFRMNVNIISDEVLYNLKEYEWPGNIKELEHIIESTMKLMKDEEIIEFHHLPTNFNHRTPQENEFLLQKDREIKPLEEYLQEAELYYIQKALQFHHFNITKTANALQMSRQNLQYRIRKHGIVKKTK